MADNYNSRWTGAEIDNGIEAAVNAVPLDGSKDMTGALGFTFSGQHSRIVPNTGVKALSFYTEATGVGAAYVIFNENFLQYQTTQDKVSWNIYDILHTGNKPSGSYTGNGSAATRQIDTGGIGLCLMIQGNSYAVLVTSQGGLAFSNDGATIKALPNTAINYYNGVLSIATADAAVNGANAVHNYQVL